MSFFVQPKIIEPRSRIVAFRRCCIISFVLRNIISYFLSAVHTICKNITFIDFYFEKQQDSCFTVMYLSIGKREVYRTTQSVYYCMNFGCFTASANTDNWLFYKFTALFSPCTLRMCFYKVTVNTEILKISIFIQRMKNIL